MAEGESFSDVNPDGGKSCDRLEKKPLASGSDLQAIERGTVEVKADPIKKVKAFELFTNEENKKLTDFINALDVLHGLGSSDPTQDNY